MNYIWRKRAGAGWLDKQSEHLIRRFGSGLAIVERPGHKRVLVEISCRTEKGAKQLAREFGGEVERLERGWLQHFERQTRSKPLSIGSRLVVLRAPEIASRAKPNRARSLVIPAETAFGTGEHVTTAMCLRLLERITRPFHPGWTMLDAGTGSGILAIAGSFFGAGRVLAIDSDPLACTTARRNVRANGARNIEISSCDVLSQGLTGAFRIIIANLFSELVIKALPIWSRHLDPEGYLILSGVLRNQESAVVGALLGRRFTIPEIRRRGKWIALVSRPPRSLLKYWSSPRVEAEGRMARSERGASP